MSEDNAKFQQEQACTSEFSVLSRAEQDRIAMTGAATEREHHLRDMVRALREQRDAAYAERNQVVALLARMANRLGESEGASFWRAWVSRHPDLDTDWEDDWRTLLFIQLPTGQATWHFHDSERHLLQGLPTGDNVWDGHDTPEKYRRVNACLAPLRAVET